jgi:hypothetical protein
LKARFSDQFTSHILNFLGKTAKQNTVKYFYLFPPIFVVSIKWIDPWVLEFTVSNTTGNNQWENYISLDFNFRGLIMIRQYQILLSRVYNNLDVPSYK